MNDNFTPESTASQPPALQNLEAFKELFPGVVVDGALDAARLGEALNLPVTGLKDGKERFGLQWAGKKLAVEALQTPSMAALAPDFENSINWDTAENVFIEGDNLEVLKLLQNAYNDQVKLIYIDPPYNTGNDFVYNDDFSDPIKHYLEVTGQVDAEGNRLVANTEVSGRKHSNWLNMMYPRLMLARNLLTQDGSIFISIDDNEVHNLRSLMDEIFGPENFIGQFVWAAGRKNNAKYMTVSHEYILVYARNVTIMNEKVGSWRQRKMGLDDIYAAFSSVSKSCGSDYFESTRLMKQWFQRLPEDAPAKRSKHYACVDKRGLFFPDNISAPGGGGPRYEVLHPSTGKPVKVPSRGWVYTEQRMLEMIENDLVYFGADEKSVPCAKRYLVDSEYEVPYSVFYQDGRGATKRLREFLGGEFFDFPKDEVVLQSIVEFASDKDSIIMDFFAGSGTTGHAVALQNEKDGGSRKYVLVTIDEPTSQKSFARAQGIDSVSAITLKRLQRVAESFENAKMQGLRVLKLAKSSFQRKVIAQDELQLVSETLADHAVPQNIASELLLTSGSLLSERWQKEVIAGTEFIRAGSCLCAIQANISPELTGHLGSLGVTHLVLLEDSFPGNDDLKSNLYFACKNAGITMKTF